MIWIFMESLGDKSKSKQASEKDRTLIFLYETENALECLTATKIKKFRIFKELEFFKTHPNFWIQIIAIIASSRISIFQSRDSRFEIRILEFSRLEHFAGFGNALLFRRFEIFSKFIQTIEFIRPWLFFSRISLFQSRYSRSRLA